MGRRRRPPPRYQMYREWYHTFTAMARSLLGGDPRTAGTTPGRRVLMTGLTGAGKSTLYDALHDWRAVGTALSPAPEEDFGLFVLFDLPLFGIPQTTWSTFGTTEGDHEEPDRLPPFPGSVGLPWLPDADLVVFVVDATTGLTAEVYRWFCRLQATGQPLVVVWNKCDALSDGASLSATLRHISERLAVPVVPLSARTDDNFADTLGLVHQMVDLVPDLLVPLGRELARFRPAAAQRLVQNAVWSGGLLGFEPVPLLDMPLQMLMEVRLVTELATLYGRAAPHAPPRIRTDFIVTLIAASVIRYGSQQVAKLVPVLGWLISGVISMAGTWLIGWSAARHFAASVRGDSMMQVLRYRLASLSEWWHRYSFTRRRQRIPHHHRLPAPSGEAKERH